MRIFYLAVVFLLLGCVKVINPESTYAGEAPIVFSLLKAGDSIEVDVYYNYDPFQYKSDVARTITTADVFLYQSNVLVDTLGFSEDRQVYISSVVAQPLESYYFEIVTEREVLISTPVIVPIKPILIEVSKTQDERQTNIRFIDSVRTRDFYAYELFFDFLNQDGFVFFSSITPIYSQLSRCRYYEGGMFQDGAAFADVCLNDGENEIILETQVEGVNTIFTLNLYALSEDLFLYSKSLSELESSSFQDASVDPTRVHSNISNGYGLIGAFNFQDTIVIFNQTQ